MPVIYPDNATGAYRHAHMAPKLPISKAKSAMGGHVNWDDGTSVENDNSLSNPTTEYPTPNTRVKATQLSGEHTPLTI